jgi:hypothetical protein
MNTPSQHIDTEIPLYVRNDNHVVGDDNHEVSLPGMHHNCPNCGCEWCQLEKDLGECFTCGYPDPWDAVTYADTDE